MKTLFARNQSSQSCSWLLPRGVEHRSGRFWLELHNPKLNSESYVGGEGMTSMLALQPLIPSEQVPG